MFSHNNEIPSHSLCIPWLRGSWAQHGAHLAPTGPRWALCWQHEPCYLVNFNSRHLPGNYHQPLESTVNCDRGNSKPHLGKPISNWWCQSCGGHIQLTVKMASGKHYVTKYMQIQSFPLIELYCTTKITRRLQETADVAHFWSETTTKW